MVPSTPEGDAYLNRIMHKSFERLIIDRLPGFCAPEEKTQQARAASFTPRASSGEKTKEHISPPSRGGYITIRSNLSFFRRSSGLNAGEPRLPRRGSVGTVVSRAVSDSRFLRGDVNQDGQVSIQDVDALLQHIYNKDHEPACLESADVNNDGEVRLGDALQLITYVTHGLFSPAAPFPACGRDPDEEGSWGDIGCVSYEFCPEEGETEALEEDAD